MYHFVITTTVFAFWKKLKCYFRGEKQAKHDYKNSQRQTNLLKVEGEREPKPKLLWNLNCGTRALNVSYNVSEGQRHKLT